MILKGTFISVVSKEEIIEKLNKLDNRYGKASMSYGHQTVSYLKTYCHEFLDIIDTCFATDLRAVKRCRASIERLPDMQTLAGTIFRRCDISCKRYEQECAF